MTPPLYALVAYVRNPVGIFVEDLRRELHPKHAHLPAHVTVLPPRALHVREEDAVAALQEACRNVEPFEIGLGDVRSFAPVTPTVFLQVEHGAYRVRELHDALNTQVFHCDEQWPFMPHLTIVKVDSLERAQDVLAISQQRWAEYKGSRRVLFESLTFVRESAQEEHWIDLASVPLGRRLASQPR
jgi:2'-5' RNA ligase